MGWHPATIPQQDPTGPVPEKVWGRRQWATAPLSWLEHVETSWISRSGWWLWILRWFNHRNPINQPCLHVCILPLQPTFATKLPQSLAGLRRGFQILVPTSRGAEEASTAARRTEARLWGGWCCPSVRRLFRLPGCLGIYSGHPVGSSHSGRIRVSKSAADPGIKIMWMKIRKNHY